MNDAYLTTESHAIASVLGHKEATWIGGEEMTATHEDAIVALGIEQWAAAADMYTALREVWSDRYDDTAPNFDDPNVGRLLHWGETVGTFIKHGLIDSEFAHDLWWIEGLWARLASAALARREKGGEPRLYKNFEWAAGVHPRAPEGA
jgi:hypothetical protein